MRADDQQKSSRKQAGAKRWPLLRGLAAVALTVLLVLAWAPVVWAAGSFTVSSTTFNFPESDPDLQPSLPSSENPISIDITISAAPGITHILEVTANGDLVSASDTIPISNVSWTATGPNFQGGTLASGIPLQVWQKKALGTFSGTVLFFISNSWLYVPGDYVQTLDMVLKQEDGTILQTTLITVKFTVKTRAKLSLGVSIINFPSTNPDTTPTIAATENPVSVDAKAQTGSTSSVTLTAMADGADLVAGAEIITIGNVSWTATGAGFVGGTMSTVSQSAGAWTGPGARSGSFSYSFVNSWAYVPGSYSQTVTYTLTVP